MIVAYINLNFLTLSPSTGQSCETISDILKEEHRESTLDLAPNLSMHADPACIFRIAIKSTSSLTVLAANISGSFVGQLFHAQNAFS